MTKEGTGQGRRGQDRRVQQRRGQERRVQERRAEDRRRRPQLLPTTTGFPARRALAALRKHNVDPEPILERAGLSEQELNDRENRISSAAQARLLEFAAEALHDPALGFHLATEVDPRELGLVFYIASAAKDLGEAIELLGRYSRIVNEAIRVEMTRRDSDLVIEVHVVGVPTVSGCAKRRACNRGYPEESTSDHRPERSPGKNNTNPWAQLGLPGVSAVLRLSGRIWRVDR